MHHNDREKEIRAIVVNIFSKLTIAKKKKIPTPYNQPQTCPRDAAAVGSGEISEKIMSIGNPSSCSIVFKATSVENGAILSCNSDSSSRYDGGIKSYSKFMLIQILAN